MRPRKLTIEDVNVEIHQLIFEDPNVSVKVTWKGFPHSVYAWGYWDTPERPPVTASELQGKFLKSDKFKELAQEALEGLNDEVQHFCSHLEPLVEDEE